MDKRLVFQASALAAMVAVIALVVMTVALFSPDHPAQPIEMPMDVASFTQVAHDSQQWVRGFFGADSLFVLSYVMVFAGLYTLTSERARPLALVGMGAGVLTALFDATENAFFIIPTMGSAPVNEGSLPVLFLMTNLKW